MSNLSGRPILSTSTDAGLFVNRETELRTLERSVRGRTNVLVLGDRGSGRTSLLRTASSRMAKQGYRTLFVEGPLATDASEFLALLRYRIQPTREIPPLATQLADVSTAAVRTFTSSTTHMARPTGALGESELLLEMVRDIERLLVQRKEKHVAFVDELPSPEVAHVVFGRLRDELWQLPLVWVIAGDIRDRATYLRPPADAFFTRIITLGPLPDDAAFALVRKRISRKEMSDAMVRKLVKSVGGNPRRLLTSAADALIEGTPVGALKKRELQRQEILNGLGDSALRLVEELEAQGPTSASDARFLKRMGWTRGRAAQLLSALEKEGVVRGTTQRGEGGRRRKVYELVRD